MTEQELRDAIKPCILAGNTWFVHEQIKSYEAAKVAEKDAEIEALKAELEESKRVKLEGMQSVGWEMVNRFTQFLEEAYAADCPMTTDWKLKIDDNGEDLPILYIWASTTHESPITRCKELRAEIDELENDYAELKHVHDKFYESDAVQHKEILRLKAENERMREGIKRVVASNSSHPWSAIDREDLIEDVHQMNAVLKSLISPAPERPEEKTLPPIPQPDENGLLPCPFCGGKADGHAEEIHPHGGGGAMWIECQECHTKARWSHDYFEARANWNRREGGA